MFRRIVMTAICAMLALAASLYSAASRSAVLADTAGYALEFDGNNDLVLLQETVSILGAGWEDTLSVEMWVLPQSPGEPCGEPGQCDLIFGDQPRWWGISQGVLNGQDRLWLWNWDGSNSQIGIPYTVNEWLHITLVHAGGYLTAYHNGVEIGRVPSGTTLQPNTGAHPELRLGGLIKDTITWTFHGQIDEVRLWNFARTAADIQADLYRELTGRESGLMAYYRMSDGAGLTLTDDSGHGWDGQLLDGYQNIPPDGSPPQWVISTAFDLQPTVTPTFTSDPPTATTEPPTATAVPPTDTPAPPTDTAIPPDPTLTPLPPTATADPASPTPTPLLPTVTPINTGGPQITIQMFLPINLKHQDGFSFGQ